MPKTPRLEHPTMTDESTNPSATAWSSTQVYVMATVCLIIGLAVGYLFRGSKSTPAAAPQAAAAPAGEASPHPMPSLDQMKHMAEKAAEPLLDKLKADPNNPELLSQIGHTYQSTHQFKEAAEYYDKAVKLNPKNIPIRTELASCLFYSGDVDGAITQLQDSLKYDPKDANSLFNLGLIRWKGKNDTKGAQDAWEQLLKSNPKLDEDKKTEVQKLIASVKQAGAAN